jgi:hypothetical protein
MRSSWKDKMGLIVSLISEIAVDTLMRKGDDGVMRWSRTSLTMFVSMILVVLFATVDFFMNGLRFDVWCTLVAMALGVKVTDAWSKKIGK